MCTCMAGYGLQYSFLAPISDTSLACSAPNQILSNSRGRICRFPYSNSEDSTWIIAADDASTVVALALSALDTELNYDVVYVEGCSDTTCSDAWGIVQRSGTLDLFYIGSAADMMKVVGRVLRVNFASDASVARSGWSLTWQMVSALCVQCGHGSYSIAEEEDLESNFFTGSISSTQVVPAMTPCAPCPPRTTSPPGAGSVSSCLCAPGHTGAAARSFADTDSGDCTRLARAQGSNGVLTTQTGCAMAKFAVGYLLTAATLWVVIAPPRPCSVVLSIVMINTGDDGTVTVSACADASCASPVRLGEFSGTVPTERALWAADGVVRVELTVRDLGRTTPQTVGFSFAWATLPGACRACEPGTHAEQAGSVACAECHPGTFVSTAGAVGCAQCANGTYEPAAGAASCRGCGAGAYAEAQAATACSLCAGGKFSDAPQSTAQAACGTCPAGSWAGEGASACTLCPPGSAAGVADAAECVPCPAGSLAPGSGSTACTLCPAGDPRCDPLPAVTAAASAVTSSASAEVRLAVILPMGLAAFLAAQGQDRAAVAEAAFVLPENVSVVSAAERGAGAGRRLLASAAVEVGTLVRAPASRAAAVRLALADAAGLGDRLAAHGLPRPISAFVASAPSAAPGPAAAPASSDAGVSILVVISTLAAAGLCLAAAALYAVRTRRRRALRARAAAGIEMRTAAEEEVGSLAVVAAVAARQGTRGQVGEADTSLGAPSAPPLPRSANGGAMCVV